MPVSALPSDHHDDAVRLWHDCGLTRPWNDAADDLARAVAGEASAVLADVEGGRLRGTVMVGHDGHRGWLYYLAVRPDGRGTGVGTSLVRAAEAWLEERGVPKVHLMVRPDNAGVVAFYARLGYVAQHVTVLGRFFDEDLQALHQGA